MNRRRFLATSSLLALSGCFWHKQTTRSQLSEPEEADLSIGDVSLFDNAAGIPLSGVGLVTGLDGNGGSPPSGDSFRTMLEDFLRSKGRDDAKALIDSPENAMVLVTSIVPPGTRPGDPLDIEVTLPQGSKAKSLRRGYLLQCELANYDTRNNVRNFLTQNPDYSPSGSNDGLLKGHTLAFAEGPIHAVIRTSERTEPEGAESDEASAPLRSGWVWAGGKARAPRPLYVSLTGPHQRYRVSQVVAARINETFNAPGSTEKMAEAKTKELVLMNVPAQYRLNLPHFLRVVRAITLERQGEKSEYVRKLEEQILEPATAISAALRLEALGPIGVPILNAARESQYPLVRFAAAEALAYLDQPSGAEELAHLAVEHPALQAYCLTALASLGEAASAAMLLTLLGNDKPEVRYGAFRGLRSADPRAAGARGEAVPQPEKDDDGNIHRPLHWFFVHEVAPDSKSSLVHALSGKRAEIVLFGQKPELLPGCSLTAGEYTVTMRRTDTTCTVSRFSARRGRRVEQCAAAVADVLRTLAKLGCTYAEVLQMLRQADETKSLSCPFAMDALPKALTVQQLAEEGRTDPKMQQEAKMFAPNDDLGTTPTLFEAGTRTASRK